MTPRDYRESWAWVHYLLNGPTAAKAALLGYLADLRASPDAPPLSERLHPRRGGPASSCSRTSSGSARRASPSQPAPAAATTVRLQIRPRPTGRKVPRRSVLGRLAPCSGCDVASASWGMACQIITLRL